MKKKKKRQQCKSSQWFVNAHQENSVTGDLQTNSPFHDTMQYFSNHHYEFCELQWIPDAGCHILQAKKKKKKICCSKSYFKWVIVSKKGTQECYFFYFLYSRPCLMHAFILVFLLLFGWFLLLLVVVGAFCFSIFLYHHNTYTFREQEQQLAAEIPEHLDIMETTCSKYRFFSIANRFLKSYFRRQTSFYLWETEKPVSYSHLC